VMDGPQAGTLIHVCRDEKCSVHARETRYQTTPLERATRAKELLAERVEKLTRIRILEAIRKKLPDALARPDLEMAVFDYFRRLGHDNHRRLCRIYRWEEKKSKAAWGGVTVDYHGIAGKAMREMNAQNLQHFLVMCALVSDVYCPGYNPSQSLTKDSNLARTAARYKIDTEKIAGAVRSALIEKKQKAKKESDAAKAPKPAKRK
jgi:hypothetical protein